MAKAKEGRPTDYDPKYCEMIIAHCSKGKSVNSFANKVKTTPHTLWNWQKKHPEFFDAVQQARCAAREYLEDIALQFLVSPGGRDAENLNFNVWTRFMQMTGWKDTEHIEVETKSPEAQAIQNKIDGFKTRIDELESQIEEMGYLRKSQAV